MMCIMINDDSHHPINQPIVPSSTSSSSLSSTSLSSSSRKRSFDQVVCENSVDPIMLRGKNLSYYPVDKYHRRSYPTSSSSSSRSRNAYRQSSSAATSTAVNIEVIPTADDYANLVFCDSDDEDESAPPLKSKSSSTRSSKSKPHKQRRSVSFTTSTPTIHHIHDLPQVHTLTPHEKSRQWLSTSDLESIKSSAQTTISHMRILARGIHDMVNFRKMMTTLEEETTDSVRGLEHRVFRRKVTRKTLIQNVLECQKHIRGLEMYDREEDVLGMDIKCSLLANVSRKGSKVAVALAVNCARDDFEEVHGKEGGGGGQKRKVSTTNAEV